MLFSFWNIEIYLLIDITFFLYIKIDTYIYHAYHNIIIRAKFQISL